LDILKDKLDKGVISEKQYEKRVADIRKKALKEQAQEEKKSAVYKIIIQTAINVVKAFGNAKNMIAAAALGAIKMAAVIAQPIPKYAEGTEYVHGAGTSKSDSVTAKLSVGERVVPAEINKYLIGIKNRDLPALVAQKTDDRVVKLLSNMGWTYQRDGYTVLVRADGSKIEKFKN